MGKTTYNNKHIAEVIASGKFNRASLKHATGKSNESTAIRWEKGENIYVTELCKIADYWNEPITNFFLYDDQAIVTNVPIGSVEGTRGKKRIASPAENAGVTITPVPSVQNTSANELQVMKMQLEHQKEMMEERERYHTLEMENLRIKESVRTEVRSEYDILISEKNKQISDKDNIIAEKNSKISEDASTISALRAEIATLHHTIAMMSGKTHDWPMGVAEERDIAMDFQK